MPNEQPSTGRLEAFSDGVIAGIITIMVLELKVPHADGVAGLRAILPILLVYLLSFTYTGIYWINHHHLLDRIRRVDPRVLYSNLVFLFSLSLLPFFTSWVIEKHLSAQAVIFYAVSLCFTGAGYLLLRLSVERLQRREGTHAATDVAEQRKHWLSLALYLISLPVALVHPLLALVCDALVTLIWILPAFGTQPHRRQRIAEEAEKL